MMTGARLRRACSLVFLALITLAVNGCGGDDGDRGPAGEAGPPPVIGTRSVPPEALNPKITDVSVSSPVVVDFQVTDERGFAVVGIDSGVQFTVNKLVPGADGETDVWSTYIRSDDEGVTDAQAGTYSNGTLEDHGDGRYTFTFADDLEDISGIPFQPSLTHRVGIELRDVMILGEEIPAGSNAVYDFQPSTGKTSGIAKREIVENESCATCHGPDPFSFHGGPRKDVRYCVTCHQKGSEDIRANDGDPATGPITIDFRVLIHKIHNGSDEAVYCGFTCEVLGFGPDDFSDVNHPQDVRNCTTCHDDSNPDTPQASQVFNRPTAAVCASCHEDLAFDANGLTNANNNHDPGAASNSECATCHADGGLAPDKVVRKAHEIPAKVWAARFEYNILGITISGTNTPVVDFSITDPTNGDSAYNLLTDPEFTSAEASVNMDVAWPTSDYTNVSNATGTDVTGGPPSRPASVPLVSGDGATATLGAGVVDNGDGTYTVDTGITIPATTPALGSGAIAIEGHTGGDFNNDGTYDDSVPVTSVVDYFAINDGSAQARRDVVDPAKCQNCHGQNDGLAFHGDNRTDNTQVCVVCHNPNQTDLFMRPEDTDEAFDGDNPAADDDLEDRTIDFKYMIHAIHGSEIRENDYIAYGFGVQSHNFGDTHIPQSVSNCLMCHEEGTFELPLGSNVLATTLSSGATVDTTVTGFANPGATAFHPGDGSASDPTDDANASATAAVCSSCHDSASAADHMDRNGSGGTSFGDAFLTTTDTQSAIDAALPAGENCAFCHGPGGFLDVAEVHEEAGE